MQVKFTLTTELPTYCLGLWDSREDAEEFMRAAGLEGEGVIVTPIFFS